MNLLCTIPFVLVMGNFTPVPSTPNDFTPANFLRHFRSQLTGVKLRGWSTRTPFILPFWDPNLPPGLRCDVVLQYVCECLTGISFTPKPLLNFAIRLTPFYFDDKNVKECNLQKIKGSLDTCAFYKKRLKERLLNFFKRPLLFIYYIRPLHLQKNVI